jgi:hypothetical protein
MPNLGVRVCELAKVKFGLDQNSEHNSGWVLRQTGQTDFHHRFLKKSKTKMRIGPSKPGLNIFLEPIGTKPK